MTTKNYNNTDKGNGFDGVAVNETLNAEIDKRWEILEAMNQVSGWTKKMEEKGLQLEKEINELLEARIAWEDKN